MVQHQYSSAPLVVARVRPYREHIDRDDAVKVKVGEDGKSISIGDIDKTKTVVVDSSYGPDSENQEVFQPFSTLIAMFLQRINVAIMAYGETGSGKTYTMSYITEKFIHDLMEQLSGGDYLNFNLQMSVVEIDNEQIFDLLPENPKAKSAQSLKVQNFEAKGAFWRVLTESSQVSENLSNAYKRRKTASTEFNEVSSRSHAFCQIKVTATLANGSSFDSIVHFIDLAGSERTGKATKEGNPNVSLSLLCKIVSDMATGKPVRGFRQSKLTHMLQPALTGRCKIGLLFTFNPCSESGATSTTAFSKNMMAMPVKRLEQNPMRLTEQELQVASAQLMAREAQIGQLEESRHVLEEENKKLREEVEEARIRNLSILALNKELKEQLTQQSQVKLEDLDMHYTMLQSMLARFEDGAQGLLHCLQEMLAAGNVEDQQASAQLRSEIDLLLDKLRALRVSIRGAGVHQHNSAEGNAVRTRDEIDEAFRQAEELGTCFRDLGEQVRLLLGQEASFKARRLASGVHSPPPRAGGQGGGSASASMGRPGAAGGGAGAGSEEELLAPHEAFFTQLGAFNEDLKQIAGLKDMDENQRLQNQLEQSEQDQRTGEATSSQRQQSGEMRRLRSADGGGGGALAASVGRGGGVGQPAAGGGLQRSTSGRLGSVVPLAGQDAVTQAVAEGVSELLQKLQLFDGQVQDLNSVIQDKVAGITSHVESISELSSEPVNLADVALWREFRELTAGLGFDWTNKRQVAPFSSPRSSLHRAPLPSALRRAPLPSALRRAPLPSALRRAPLRSPQLSAA
ncbi:hypothetical protein CYMTET_24759, partial [Cymbomonas tetramitiformis]